MVGLLAWGVVVFSTPFCAVIAHLHSWCLNLAHSSPELQLTSHCYFYGPLADQQVCHHPLRPASHCLEQSLRLHQQKSSDHFQLRKKKNKQAQLFLALLCSIIERQEHSLCSAASLCPAPTLLFSQRSSLAGSSSDFLAGNPTCLRVCAPRLHPRLTFSPIVNCF